MNTKIKIVSFIFLFVFLFSLSFFYIERASMADSNLGFVIIPDMQNESKEVIDSICQWIIDNKTSQNIQAVITTGDLTNNAVDNEFQRIVPCFNILDAAGIVYVPLVGNHDYDGVNPQGRATVKFNQYFGPTRFSGKTWYAGNYNNDNANYYVKLTIGSRKFLILALEFFPRPEVVNWASSILDNYWDYEAIITTHGYLNPNNTRTIDSDNYGILGYGLPTSDNSGEDLWNNLIKKKGNIKFVVSGHQLSGNNAFRSDVGEMGNAINQVFNNYQLASNGGDGWIGLVKVNLFSDNSSITYVKTYNPDTFSFKWPVGTASVSSSWYNDAWQCRKTITINHSKISADISSFPVLVSLYDPDLKLVAYRGMVANKQGLDIVFTDSFNNKIPYEIEKYEPATGRLVAWVNVPKISSATDTQIYMYFSNPLAIDQQNKAGVWNSNYMGVWHLKETTGSHNDSSQRANNSNALLVLNQGSASGKIDGADLLGETDNYISIPSTASSLKKQFSKISISAWIYPLIHSSATYGPTIISNTDADGWAMRINDGYLEPDLRLTDGNFMKKMGTRLPLNAWSYIDIVYDGSQIISYVNGVNVGSMPASGTMRNSANNSTCTFLGNDPAGCVVQWKEFLFNGNIDEVRVSDIAYSSAWINAEYLNQSSPNSFMSFSETQTK